MLFLISLSMTMLAVFTCFYCLTKALKSLTPKILCYMERFAGLLTSCLALDIVIDGIKTYCAGI
jgi:small neutral amino acid transporter SnatA (MarC family)